MVLKALEIQGFKSFPDKTKITFDRGITGVVGPNGSGKSNISDAMRWVLGETSSKQLRGGGKMEDVIFGGTQGRSQMGFAAVSLYIDNTDRGLDVDRDEVVITRKYYRSGESEYAVNGQNVRLRDVYELLLDTGLGRDGYSIIGQGRIAEIVGAKSNERREIFEEASGIAKYRYRKNEAERRLAATEENLVRLRDILGELTERVGPLERDSAKAKKFLELSERRRELEVTLWVDGVRRAKEALRDHQRKIETAQADHEAAQKRLEACEQSGEEAFLQARRLEAQAQELSDEVRAITEEQGQQAARTAVYENDLQHTAEKIESLQEEMRLAGESALGTAQRRQEHETAIRAGEEQLAALDQRLGEVEGTLEELSANSRRFDQHKQTLEEELVELADRQTRLQVEEMAARTAAEEQASRLNSAREEQRSARERMEAARAERADTAAFLEEVNKKLTAVRNVKSGLSFKLDSRTKQLESAAAENEKLSRALEGARQRIGVLTDLEQNLDGFSGSVKTVMRASAGRRLRGVVGPVSTILQVRPGYEVAIETALGFALQNIVVENEAAAKEAMAFLKAENAGRATFLPLDTVRGRSVDKGALTGGAMAASEAVQYESRYENIVSSLLGRILLVEDINEASRVARQNGYRYRVVTRDGQVINAGGSFTGGSVARSAGLFSRKIEIEELRKKAARYEEQIRQAAEELRRRKQETAALAAELSAAEGEEVTHNGDRIRCEVELSRMDSALSQEEAALTLLTGECEQLEASLQNNRERAAQAARDLELAKARTAALEEEFAASASRDDGFVQARDKLSAEQQELRMERYAAAKDMEVHREAIRQLEAQHGREGEQRARLEESIRQLEARQEEIRLSQQEVEQEKGRLADKLASVKGSIEKNQLQRAELDRQSAAQRGEVRALSEEKEQLSKEVARLEERKNALETEYDSTIAKLWEEYELTLSEAAALTVEFSSVTDLRRQVGEVRGSIRALGNVNVGAIEEYEQVKSRYEFLREQVGDVESSKAELMELIGGLTSEMETIFRDSFAEINDHFGRIFTELFGGGSARLYLSEEDNVLESGIEIEVAPPGKIIKNLSALSGGEQALVAISIYFAILAVNPSPFCVLDEIEAALDDVNVVRFASYLRRICDHTQFVVITHRRGSMEEADVLYGVTMQEDGVSKILRLDANQVEAHLVS